MHDTTPELQSDSDGLTLAVRVPHPFVSEGCGSSGVGLAQYVGSDLRPSASAIQDSADSGQTKDKSRTAPLDPKGCGMRSQHRIHFKFKKGAPPASQAPED
jgi:hypothetical protein